MRKASSGKLLSKSREAKMRAAFRILGRAYVELLIKGEKGERSTTDWQVALDLADRLQQQMSFAEWDRLTGAPGFLAAELTARHFFGAPTSTPTLPARRTRAAAKPAVH